MKTKNNVQKTRLTAAAVLVILGITVNAQNFMNSLFENNEANQIAMLTEKTKSNTATSTANTGNFFNANSFSAYLVKESEKPLDIEDWMFEKNIFTIPVEIEAETENTIDVAGRIATETTFRLNSMTESVKTEEQLNLEDWMLDEKIFNLNQNITKSIVQKINNINSGSTLSEQNRFANDEVAIEEWMNKPENWKK